MVKNVNSEMNSRIACRRGMLAGGARAYTCTCEQSECENPENIKSRDKNINRENYISRDNINRTRKKNTARKIDNPAYDRGMRTFSACRKQEDEVLRAGAGATRKRGCKAPLHGGGAPKGGAELPKKTHHPTKRGGEADSPRKQILPGHRAIAVDGACSHNPGGLIEYRGVGFNGEEVFHFGPVEHGTNNIAEFLAIVHALALLEQEGLKGVTVYSDSQIAINWVGKRVCRTNYMPPQGSYLRNVIERALRWLQSHNPANKVVKWPTRKWGEIPADFGRKGKSKSMTSAKAKSPTRLLERELDKKIESEM